VIPSKGGDPPAIFEICDGALAEATPELLGLWITVPEVSAGGLAFAAPPPTPTAAARWRVNLSGDLSQAAAELGKAEARLERSQQELAVAAERLSGLVAAQRSEVAFDLYPGRTGFAQPEAELLTLLRMLQEGTSAVDFGLGETIVVGWQQATEQLQAFVGRLLHSVSHYAWVETRLEGHLLGRTILGWTGAVDTIWQAGLSSAQAALHERAAALALASRETLIRTLVVVAQGAVTLSVLLATPGGAVLALPAAWKFIDRVSTELSQD